MFSKIKRILKSLMSALTTIKEKIARDWERADRIDEHIKRTKEEILQKRLRDGFFNPFV